MSKNLRTIMGFLFIILVLCSCTNEVQLKKLQSPGNLRTVDDVVMWNNTDYAVSYVVKINDNEYTTSHNSFSLIDFEMGTYIIAVKAVGDGKDFESSAYSSSITYEKKNKSGNIVAPFSSFDDLTTKEAYIGYGIDIISATGINSKNVKTTYPIFNPEKLRQERLLKSNEHYSSFIASEGETIEQLLENMGKSSSSSAGMNVAVKAKFWTTNASISAALSAGAESSLNKSQQGSYRQRFLQILSENQSYWLMLQSSEARYKELLTEEFKSDLYNPMISPASLFNKYGTHILTSVAMGGSIALNYTLSEMKESSENNLLESISNKIQANVSYAYGKKVGVDVGTNIDTDQVFSYRAEASSKEVFVKQTVICAGGDSYGINSEDTLLNNYDEWQKSLDKNPVVIGIKDSNSLYPIWYLIDLSIPGASERFNELEDYFQEYGIDSYTRVCEEYAIQPPVSPESIDEIKVDGIVLDDASQTIKVYAGTSVYLNFSVFPENATGYKKVFLLNDKGAEYEVYENGIPVKKSYVDVSDKGIITIDSNTPSGIIFSVKISAGPVSKVITFQVESTYTVSFNTRIDGLEISPYKSVKYGANIPAPEISREGYKLEGWYRDIDNKVKFDFDVDHVIANITLYAKWTPIFYNVSFIIQEGTESIQIKVRYGEKIDIKSIDNPTRDGYIFDGWFTEPECYDEFDFTKTISSNTKIYAKWIPKVYTVRFETNGKGETPSPIKVSADSSFKVEEPAVTCDDYDLEGWYEDVELTKRFSFDSKVKSDILLYAKWIPKIVVLKFVDINGNQLFDVNGKIIQDAITSIEKGYKVDSIPDPVLVNHSFNHWVLEQNRIDLTKTNIFKPKPDGSSYIITAIFDDELPNQTTDGIAYSESDKTLYVNIGSFQKLENDVSLLDTEYVSSYSEYVQDNVLVVRPSYNHSEVDRVVISGKYGLFDDKGIEYSTKISNFSMKLSDDWTNDLVIIVKNLNVESLMNTPVFDFGNCSANISLLFEGKNNIESSSSLSPAISSNNLVIRLCDENSTTVITGHPGVDNQEGGIGIISETISILGEGNILINGGNGGNGVGHNGKDGKPGKDGAEGVQTASILFDIDGNVCITGGNAGNGADGLAGDNGAPGSRYDVWFSKAGNGGHGGTGGKGGNSGLPSSAISINNASDDIVYKNGQITMINGNGGSGGTGGKGGDGGNGGNSNAWGTEGGDAGNAGNGGAGGDGSKGATLNIASPFISSQTGIDGIVGKGGQPGSVGKPGFYDGGGDYGARQGKQGQPGTSGIDGNLV